jgi:hypothetical protein
VLANGTVLVDGNAATLEEVEAGLASTKEASGHVWYYREAAPGEAPAIAKLIIERVVAHKLQVSLSTKPDFSDWVDAKGVSHPRIPAGGAETDAEMDEYFATVRRTAAGKGDGEGLVIVKPDRTLMVLPRMAESPELKSMADNVAKMVPADTQRNIAAIGHTVFEDPGGLAEVGKAIPFFGILVGLSYIGHAVWVFDGRGSSLISGCREADLVIVDSAVRPSLPAGWDAKAASIMRSANILVHNRANFGLSAIRKVGKDPRRFEFNDAR